jgi:hypothetical protein
MESSANNGFSLLQKPLLLRIVNASACPQFYQFTAFHECPVKSNSAPAKGIALYQQP